MKARILVVAAAVAALAITITTAQRIGPATPSLLKPSFGRVPIHLVENRGVYPESVKFYVQGRDKTLFFQKDRITFQLRGPERGWAVNLVFVDASPDVALRGKDRQTALFSYFRGPEKDWKTGLPTFSRVVYENLWPGIDLVYRAGVGRLKYEFVVKPGADPAAIRFRYVGSTEIAVAASGGLRVATPVASFEDAPPVAWQVVRGKRVPVKAAFRQSRGPFEGDAEIGFEIGSYDSQKTLVVDPAVFVFCGYIGGANVDSASDIAIDSSGNLYLTGSVASAAATFPVAVGPDLTFNGSVSGLGDDAFVAKLNPTGTKLLYCGYIGGSAGDGGHSIDVDPSGNAYVTGITYSDQTTFPVKKGPDLTFNGHPYCDAFVAKVNASGTALEYCGYIGGTEKESGLGIAVDPAGCAYVTGETRSTEMSFPVVVGPDLTFNSIYHGPDVFVAKLDPTGTTLLYCGYIGGWSGTYGSSIVVDTLGYAYVVGETLSDESTFPVKLGPDLTYNGGLGDNFVAKVHPTGAFLVFCGYIGGMKEESWANIALDGSGDVYVAGLTQSDEGTFPVKGGPDLTYNGVCDVYVAKIRTDGTGLVYCGYIGGSGMEHSAVPPGTRGNNVEIAVDGEGSAHVTAVTMSDELTFPVKIGPSLKYSGTNPGYSIGDAFLAKVNATGMSLDYCGYIGGSGFDSGLGAVIDGSGNAYVCGYTESSESTFPVVGGPCVTYNGGGDAFVAKVAFTHLDGSGKPQPGGTVTLALRASDDGGLAYQMGSSLSTGPIPVGGKRMLGLGVDDLLVVSVSGVLPGIFPGVPGDH